MDITIHTEETKAIQLGQQCDVEPDCKTCGKCCEKGSGYVLEKDIPLLAKTLGVTEDVVKEKYLDEVWMFHTQIWKLKQQSGPVSPCVFYDKGCTIHEGKPLHCKTATWDSKLSEPLWQWFMITHVVNKHNKNSVDEWNTYLKTAKHIIKGGHIDYKEKRIDIND